MFGVSLETIAWVFAVVATAAPLLAKIIEANSGFSVGTWLALPGSTWPGFSEGWPGLIFVGCMILGGTAGIVGGTIRHREQLAATSSEASS